MSGGSFNYLYSKDAEDILSNHMGDISDMIEILKNDYDSPNRREYADILGNVLTYLDTCKGLMRSVDVLLNTDLREVMQAVEWHRSSDKCKQDVEDLLNEKDKS